MPAALKYKYEIIPSACKNVHRLVVNHRRRRWEGGYWPWNKFGQIWNYSGKREIIQAL